MLIHKALLTVAIAVQLVLQHAVVQGHEMFNITMYSYWQWAEKWIYVLLFLVVTYPVTWILSRRKNAS